MNFKKSMISVAAASVLAVSFVGCDTGTNTTVNTPNTTTVNKVATPIGTVTGLVQDTNGNPLENVKVYLAGKTTVTDAGGVYTFADVPVTTTSTDGSNDTAHESLSVTIAAPAGYLGATVTVKPKAQLDHTNNDNNGTAGITADVATFIDGYLAQAGTAVLPALTSGVTGVLRDENTGTPIAGATIILDLTKGGSTATATAQEQAQNGVNTTYAVSTYKVTTDATGAYAFANIPSDSTFTAHIPGYNLTSGKLNTAFVTDTEDVITQGDSTATAIVSIDNKKPMVAGVIGDLDANDSREMLEDNMRTSFTINFTEAMAIETDKDYTNSVIVKAGATDASMATIDGATTTVAADKRSITVTVPSELASGTQLDITLLKTDFKDLAGNFITTNPAIAWDDAAKSGQTLTLELQIFKDLNTNASAVTVKSQDTTDENGVNALAALQAANASFNNVKNGTAGTIYQMNSSSENNVSGRLSVLASALNGGTPADAVVVKTNTARITFTPTNSAYYVVSLANSTGTAKSLLNTNVTVQNGTTVLKTGATEVVTIANTDATKITLADATNVTPVEFVIADGIAKAGDVVKFTPYDDLGYAGTPSVLTLVDNVAPTTILQKSYNAAGTNTNTGANTVVKYGDGGELAANAGENIIGTPYLVLAPGLLDNLTATGVKITNIGADRASDNTLKYELSALSTKDTNGSYGLTENTTIPSQYDATAFANFTDLTRTVGVAFSENVDLNAVTPSFDGTETLSYAVNNDVKVNDDNKTVDADLVNVTTTNIFALANDEDGKIIDFAGIKDAAGNPSSTAKVVLKDAMPPFVTKATWNGTKLEMTFNEKLAPIASYTGTHKIVVNGTSVSITKDSNITINGNVMSFYTGGTNGLGVVPEFIGKQYAESTYGTTKYIHADLNVSGVMDAKGNDWANSKNIATPIFAAVDIVPNLDTISNVGYSYDLAGGDANLSVTMNQSVRALFNVNNITDSNSSTNYDASGVVSADTKVIANVSEFLARIIVTETNSSKIHTGTEVFSPSTSSFSINGAVISAVLADHNSSVDLTAGSIAFKINTSDTNATNPKYNKVVTVNPVQ